MTQIYEHYRKNIHVFSVVDSPEKIKQLTPCYIEIPSDIFSKPGLNIQVAEFCQTVYVLLPWHVGLSTLFRVQSLIDSHLPKGKNYVLLGRHLSDRAISIIESQFGVKVINYE